MNCDQLLPLFDTIENLHLHTQNLHRIVERFRNDFLHTLEFLKSYRGSLGTFNSYRREVERLLQWCILIRHKTISELKREDIEQFIQFCQSPPTSWISIKKVPRFIDQNGLRTPNPLWRPFVATLDKFIRKQGAEVSVQQFKLSQGAIQEIFAILSTLFNFLISEEYLVSNPVSLIRQKSKFIRKRQQAAPIRRLSLIQWEAVLNASEILALQDPQKHERTRFLLSMLYGMYLRISEVVASDRWIPMMHDFSKDSQGAWWFRTIGKGNKERQIAVSPAVLNSLIRWRTFLGLTPLPSPADNTVLLPKIRGQGPMTDSAAIRRIIQQCFDLAAHQLREGGQTEEADHLGSATVHWLRHTGISEDVKIRPREHVRDDAGHSSGATTDRYIDVERQARHRSAQQKRSM